MMKGILELEFAWDTILTVPSEWVGILDTHLMKAHPSTVNVVFLVILQPRDFAINLQIRSTVAPESGHTLIVLTVGILQSSAMTCTLTHCVGVPISISTGLFSSLSLLI